MIKLDRTPKPVELTTALQVALTDEFKLTGKSVWNIDFIKKALLGNDAGLLGAASLCF